MSVLVTGGAGYIGSHMVLGLLDSGEDVVVLDNLSTGLRSAVPNSAKFAQGDVGDREFVKRLLTDNDIDAVMHFAGSVVVPQSLLEPLSYYQNNTCNSRTLIECVVEAGIEHFIFSSTAAVYGMPPTSLVDEDAPLEPISPYGSSKLMTEIMLRDAAQAHDFSYVVLRYFNVAGADPLGRAGQSTEAATHLIKVAAEAALGHREYLEVYGTDYPTRDGTCVRDYIHVSDLIAAHWSALRYLRGGGQSETFNCGYGRGYSVLDVVGCTKRVAGSDFPVRLRNRRPGDPATLVARADRLTEKLNWRPRYDKLDTIISHALAWEKRCAKRPP